MQARETYKTCNECSYGVQVLYTFTGSGDKGTPTQTATDAQLHYNDRAHSRGLACLHELQSVAPNYHVSGQCAGTRADARSHLQQSGELAGAVQAAARACQGVKRLPPTQQRCETHRAVWAHVATALEALLLLRALAQSTAIVPRGKTTLGSAALRALLQRPAAKLVLESAIDRAITLDAAPPFAYASALHCAAPALEAWAAQLAAQRDGLARAGARGRDLAVASGTALSRTARWWAKQIVYNRRAQA